VRDVRNVHALEKKRMRKLLECSVARRVRSPISNLPFSAILLMIWLIAPVLSPADSVGANQRTVTKLDENIYVILHQDA